MKFEVYRVRSQYIYAYLISISSLEGEVIEPNIDINWTWESIADYTVLKNINNELVERLERINLLKCENKDT